MQKSRWLEKKVGMNDEWPKSFQDARCFAESGAGQTSAELLQYAQTTSSGKKSKAFFFAFLANGNCTTSFTPVVSAGWTEARTAAVRRKLASAKRCLPLYTSA